MAADLVVRRPQGLYCPAGDFYVDPWRKVERAVITHAHADHARAGHRHYLTAQRGVGVLRARLGRIDVTGLDWGEAVTIGAARVSLHPAGHILGSAQVRIEVDGQVWVLVHFVPVVGSIILIIVDGLLPGTHGPNRFGVDPREALARARINIAH